MVAKDLPVTSLTWTSPFIPPGLYVPVKIEGTVDGAPFDQMRDAMVKSGEKATPSAPDVELKLGRRRGRNLIRARASRAIHQCLQPLGARR
jgi:hypothetical protein